MKTYEEYRREFGMLAKEEIAANVDHRRLTSFYEGLPWNSGKVVGLIADDILNDLGINLETQKGILEKLGNLYNEMIANGYHPELAQRAYKSAFGVAFELMKWERATTEAATPPRIRSRRAPQTYKIDTHAKMYGKEDKAILDLLGVNGRKR